MIVTTCGQSPGAVMVNMVAVQSGFTSASDNSLTAETLDTSAYKTLVVTAGTSMKGMARPARTWIPRSSAAPP